LLLESTVVIGTERSYESTMNVCFVIKMGYFATGAFEHLGC